MTGQVWKVKSGRTDMSVRTFYRWLVAREQTGDFHVAPAVVLLDAVRERLALDVRDKKALVMALGFDGSKSRDVDRWTAPNGPSYQPTILLLAVAGYLTEEAKTALLADPAVADLDATQARLRQKLPTIRRRLSQAQDPPRQQTPRSRTR